jgi:hypothetical protein
MPTLLSCPTNRIQIRPKLKIEDFNRKNRWYNFKQISIFSHFEWSIDINKISSSVYKVRPINDLFWPHNCIHPVVSLWSSRSSSCDRLIAKELFWVSWVT